MLRVCLRYVSFISFMFSLNCCYDVIRFFDCYSKIDLNILIIEL